MELLRKHTKIAVDMYSKGLKLDFIKEFKIEDIEKCCNEMEKLNIDKAIYENDEIGVKIDFGHESVEMI